MSFEKEPSLIVVDRCEDAEVNCFHISPWSRAPTLQAVAEGRSVLRFGHRGEAVEEVQHFLNENHPRGKPLAVDGYLGPETEARLRSFQANHGLVVDGVLGPKTLKAMADLSVRGLMVDARFAGLSDELQRSAINRIEGTESSEEKMRLARILVSEGFASLKPDSQARVLAADDPAKFFAFARALHDSLSSIK